jgi:hypothetical protein
VGDLQVAVVPGHPADGDEVARHVEPALAAEDHVVQRRVLAEPPAHPAARPVPLDHEVADVGRHQAEPLQLQFRNTHSSTLGGERKTMADPTLRGRIRTTISNAYYDARNDGLTMESAADDAADRVMNILIDDKIVEDPTKPKER